MAKKAASKKTAKKSPANGTAKKTAEKTTKKKATKKKAPGKKAAATKSAKKASTKKTASTHETAASGGFTIPDDLDSVAAIAAAVQSGERTAADIVDEAIARIGDDPLHAFLGLDADRARERAAAVDAKRDAGESLGPLAGVPVAIKDNIAEAGEQLTCASRFLEGYRSPYSAGVIEKLLAADAVPLGRTNLDEFAMGSSTENSAFGPTRNPHDLDCVPGGSSGGSAAAVGGGYVPVALGSDTGGSIRQPAAFCGCVGLKPSYGRVSRYGLVAFASSLDQIGPFGRSVADAEALFDAIAGPDLRDSTSSRRPFTPRDRSDDRPLKIGLVKEQSGEHASEEARTAYEQAIEAIRAAGCETVDVSLPNIERSVAVYYVVAPCEASSNLARFDGIHYGRRAEASALGELYDRSRGEGFGPEVKRRVMLGAYALSSGYYDAYYKTALRVRRLISQDYQAALSQCDALLTPVTPDAAYKIGTIEDPLQVYLNDIYTIGANLAGLPAISIPVSRNAAGLPLGVQLLSGWFQEWALLLAASKLEAAVAG